MESGVVPPPPRRSAPRSLLGSKDPRRTAESGASGSAAPAHHNEGDGETARERQLHEMLGAETSERQRLETALKEQGLKFKRSLGLQSQLEEELVSRDARINLLSDELRVLKQRKQNTDSELAQYTADYMNGQAKWLEQVDQLNDEIQLLKVKLSASTVTAKSLEKELNAQREREWERDEEQKKAARVTRPDNVQAAAESLEKHQNDLLLKELRARHSQLQTELDEIRAVNERLREDNENFQYLLVERTVSGSLPQTISGSDLGQTLADEEIFDFDPSGEVECEDKTQTSLADESASPASPATPPDSEVGTNTKALQLTITKQKFELQSLRNHNRALKLSLERLVDRLLDNGTFSRAVEEAVSTSTVQRFRQRVASTSTGASGSDGDSWPHAEQPQMPASMWSNMIFNTQHTGTPSRRVISLGIDNEVRSPSPIVPQYTGNTMRTVSTTGSTDGMSGSLGRLRYQFGRGSNASSPSVQSSDGSPSKIQVAKRIDSQSGLRKLRLRE